MDTDAGALTRYLQNVVVFHCTVAVLSQGRHLWRSQEDASVGNVEGKNHPPWPIYLNRLMLHLFRSSLFTHYYITLFSACGHAQTFFTPSDSYTRATVSFLPFLIKKFFKSYTSRREHLPYCVQVINDHQNSGILARCTSPMPERQPSPTVRLKTFGASCT